MTIEEKKARVHELMMKDHREWGLSLQDIKEMQRLQQEIDAAEVKEE